MLVSQRSVSGKAEGQGCLRTALSELQRCRAASGTCEEGLRQRLLVLSQRLARVRTLGNEYARVAFSKDVEALLAERAQAV